MECNAGDGAGKAFMKKYVAQPRTPEHARYGKAKEMVEKKVSLLHMYNSFHVWPVRKERRALSPSGVGEKGSRCTSYLRRALVSGSVN